MGDADGDADAIIAAHGADNNNKVDDGDGYADSIITAQPHGAALDDIDTTGSPTRTPTATPDSYGENLAIDTHNHSIYIVVLRLYLNNVNTLLLEFAGVDVRIVTRSTPVAQIILWSETRNYSHSPMSTPQRSVELPATIDDRHAHGPKHDALDAAYKHYTSTNTMFWFPF